LYILALSSMGVYGIILAGWASNSKYAFLGCLRSAAQMVSYEIAMGFALVGVLMVANSLNLGEIVAGQEGGAAYWYIWRLFPLGDGMLWLAIKVSFVLLIFLWIRATWPRYRYDQIMRLGWKVFIPVTLVWIVFLGAMMQTRYAVLFH